MRIARVMNRIDTFFVRSPTCHQLPPILDLRKRLARCQSMLRTLGGRVSRGSTSVAANLIGGFRGHPLGSRREKLFCVNCRRIWSDRQLVGHYDGIDRLVQAFCG